MNLIEAGMSIDISFGKKWKSMDDKWIYADALKAKN